MPSTFDEYAASASEIDQATFESTSESIHRIDFIACSSGCSVIPGSAAVHSHVQTARPSDRRLATVDLVVPLLGDQQVQRRRLAGHDRSCSFGDTFAKAKLATILGTGQKFDASLDPSSHCHSMNVNLRAAAAQAFPVCCAVAKGFRLTACTTQALPSPLNYIGARLLLRDG